MTTRTVFDEVGGFPEDLPLQDGEAAALHRGLPETAGRKQEVYVLHAVKKSGHPR